MNKQFRQEKLKQLIREEAIHTQDELVKGLRRLGVRATQVTLSRDLHELGVAKTPAGYRILGEGALPKEDRQDAIDSELQRSSGFLRDVKRAQNLIILKTTIGGAQPVALALDRENWPEVVGTIAGDDTVLVICGDNKKADKVAKRMMDQIR